MPKERKDLIKAKGFSIEIITNDFVNDFIFLTDIAKYKSVEPNDVIKNAISAKVLKAEDDCYSQSITHAVKGD